MRFRVNQRLRVDGCVHQVELGERGGLWSEVGGEFALYQSRVALRASRVLADEELGPFDDTTRIGVRIRF